ncbi:hypothetical protein A9P82_05280 [Arachidicoccus ginsenosidimutans]|uniref:TlpA disulfide reductase family protein n=1 Tax=Arachidicoccus sp. BS20 TaxID=1850526 RepID=UPI0007F0BA9A|nr:TlpA disulfide reductase family protein [Arachidicoccus sp. BS20]ANI88748.1 hypothetical protein A9P82_05280 [Arachidicoccus sp. BS20]
MKKLSLVLLCGIPVTIWAQAPFQISGSVKGVNPSVDKVYISYAANGQNVLDSANVRGNKYKFTGYITQPTRVELKAAYNNDRASLQRDVITLFAEPSDITINSVDSFSNATITGSQVNVEFQKLQTAAKPFQPKVIALSKEIAQYRKEKNTQELEQAQLQLDEVNAQLNEAVYAKYIQQNPNSPLAFFALQQYAGPTMPKPQETLQLFNLLPESMKRSHDGMRMKDLISRVLRASAGKPAPDFTQTDMNGNSVTLSSFKGKTVLINFWASWCGPCRALDADLVKLYNTYKDNNFTIINVSLDKPGEKDIWLKAIQEDGLSIFPQVTDLRFWNNAVARLYGIVSAPQNILVNADGVIVAKNLKPNQLNDKVKSLVE